MDSQPASVAVVFESGIGVATYGYWPASRDAAHEVCSAVRRATGVSPTAFAYAEHARRVESDDILGYEFDFVYGSNLQAGLRAAARTLEDAKGARRIVVVAYSQPSSHYQADGDVFWGYPPVQETTDATLEEGFSCARASIRVDFVLLSPESQFDNLASRLARATGGTVTALTSEPESIDADVIEAALSEIGII
jgi:uncharacterized protein with von Willebrand factor type A (vWA) domain